MEWWVGVALVSNGLKLWNNGWWHLSWRCWPFTILSTNLSEVMPLHWYKNWGRVLTCTTGEGGEDCNMSGTTSPMAWLPFFWVSVVLVDAHLVDFLPPWQPSDLGLRWGFFGKETPPDSGTGHSWILSGNPAIDFSLASPIEAEGWDSPREDWWGPAPGTSWYGHRGKNYWEEWRP